MSKYKISCSDTTCLYMVDGHCVRKNIEIKNRGCNSFTPNLHYYYNKVWNALHNTNMIPTYDLNEDLKIGLYYVMKTFDLKFQYFIYGNWDFISLVNKKGQTGLKYEDIVSRPINQIEFENIVAEFNSGILPKFDFNKDKEENSYINKDNENLKDRFGFISPSGSFYEGEWGEHNNIALKLIKNNNWEEEFRNSKYNSFLATDYLVQEKNYCLVHNPSMGGIEFTGNSYNLTKKQREFLYDYFLANGNKMKAEMFLGED